MSDQEVEAAVVSMAQRYQRMQEYVRFSTVLISTLPVVYGILTWVFGSALWSGSPVYQHALSVPYAPQSWGTVFIVLGVLSVWFGEKQQYRALAVTSILLGLVLGSFMFTFAAGAITSNTLSAIPPAVVYGIFALAFLNRSLLAWDNYIDESGWTWEQSSLNVIRRLRRRQERQ